MGAADHHWAVFNGWAVSRGLDILELPFDALLDLIYYWLTMNAEEDEVDKFNHRLWLPPKKAKVSKNSPWSDEATRNSLAALVGGGPAGGAVI